MLREEDQEEQVANSQGPAVLRIGLEEPWFTEVRQGRKTLHCLPFGAQMLSLDASLTPEREVIRSLLFAKKEAAAVVGSKLRTGTGPPSSAESYQESSTNTTEQGPFAAGETQRTSSGSPNFLMVKVAFVSLEKPEDVVVRRIISIEEWSSYEEMLDKIDLKSLLPGIDDKSLALALIEGSVAANTSFSRARSTLGDVDSPPLSPGRMKPSSIIVFGIESHVLKPQRSSSPENDEKFDNDLFVWGATASSTPSLMDKFTDACIIDVCYAAEHTLYLTNQGVVYVQGSTSHGQLGLGEGVLTCSLPTPLSDASLHRTRVVSIACADHHSACVTDEGVLYTWGSNLEGQCGQGSLEVRTYSSPVRANVSLVSPAPFFSKVSCGAKHTTIITRDGFLWSCGYGSQLGLGPHVPQALTPFLIRALESFYVLEVSCGDAHTLALTLPRKQPMSLASCVDNQVWSWGENNEGQLGIGNELLHFSSLPLNISSLNGMRVVRVCAGKGHSAVLTCLSSVYHFGRLLNASGAVHTPQLLDHLGLESVLDIAAGSHHVLLLTAGGNPPSAHQQVLFLGPDTPLPSKKIRYSSPNKPLSRQYYVPMATERLPSHQRGFIRRVIAGSRSSAIILDPSSPIGLVMCDATAREVLFANETRLALRSALLPLRKKEFDKTAIDVHLDTLISIFIDLWTTSCSLVAHLLHASSSHPRYLRCCGYIAELKLHEVYEQFLVVYCHAVANGSFSDLLLNKLVMEGLERDKSLHLPKPSSGPILQQLFGGPLRQAGEYLKLFTVLSHHEESLPSQEASHVHVYTQMWGSLLRDFAPSLAAAEATLQFFTEYPQVKKQLANGSRRVVRHSKTHPLALARAVLQSTNWFILFNDVFVHSQMFSSRAFPLNVSWVTPLPDSDLVKNAFRVSSPEDSVMLTCGTGEERSDWMSAIQSCQALLATPLPDGSFFLRENPSGLTHKGHPPLITIDEILIRKASYAFKVHPVFKECVYEGMWVNGQMNGKGKVVCTDGRMYVGMFKDNINEGKGVFHFPESLSLVKVAEGEWHAGRLSGFARVEYHDGSKYEGDFLNGLRHGHGIFETKAGTRYIGAWEHDIQHGYGVLDEVARGQRHLGMWSEGVRAGPGALMLADGSLYEGTFVNNKLQGKATLRTQDGISFEGEFAGEGVLQGRGSLVLPNGHCVDGLFSGQWEKGTIKVNGVWKRLLADDEEGYDEYDVVAMFASDSAQVAVGLCDPHLRWSNLFHRCKQEMIIFTSGDGGELNPMSMSGSNRLGGGSGTSSLEDIKKYLTTSFHKTGHPLSRLIDDFVEAFKASYSGIGAHRLMLYHAVSELQAILLKIDDILAFVFPEMQDDMRSFHEGVLPHMQGYLNQTISYQSNFRHSFLEPLLFSRVYSVLFTLYRLQTEELDRQYWGRVSSLHDLPDVVLFTQLAVSKKFWLMTPEREELERCICFPLHRRRASPTLASLHAEMQDMLEQAPPHPAVFSPPSTPPREETTDPLLTMVSGGFPPTPEVDNERQGRFARGDIPPFVLGSEDGDSSEKSDATSHSEYQDIPERDPDSDSLNNFAPTLSVEERLHGAHMHPHDGGKGLHTSISPAVPVPFRSLTPPHGPHLTSTGSSLSTLLPNEHPSDQELGSSPNETSRLTSGGPPLRAPDSPDTADSSTSERFSSPLSSHDIELHDVNKEGIHENENENEFVAQSEGSASLDKSHLHLGQGLPLLSTEENDRPSSPSVSMRSRASPTIRRRHFPSDSFASDVPKMAEINVLKTRLEAFTDLQHEVAYAKAIETIKKIALVFNPTEKLAVLHSTFTDINEAIKRFTNDQARLSSMDDILPIIVAVLVRAKCPHLGAEVLFLDNFIDQDAISGESKVLLTTLRAAYSHLCQPPSEFARF